jgi:hypothetical protein
LCRPYRRSIFGSFAIIVDVVYSVYFSDDDSAGKNTATTLAMIQRYCFVSRTAAAAAVEAVAESLFDVDRNRTAAADDDARRRRRR